MTPSIHDSLLHAYEVDGDRNRIVLHTRPHSGGGIGYIDVIFTGVEAYHFEGDCLSNIVFTIDEVSASSDVGKHNEFEERHRQCGWPRGWDINAETFDEFIAKHQCRIFQLSTSCGMNGFVVARAIEYVQVSETNPTDREDETS